VRAVLALMARLAARLPRLWYRRRLAFVLLALLPLAWCFRLTVAVREALYRRGLLPSYRLPVPVIVVGNLTVGGSGKTPCVLWLVDSLRAAGWQPGIVSRGHGGARTAVHAVTPDSPPALVGDEPVLLARRSGVPVFVGRDRVAAGRALLAAHPDCSVIVSDDGLQHYRLQRTVEIALFDGRGVGNAQLLPAGPLREPLSRLARVTAVLWNAPPGARPALPAASDVPQLSMRLVGRRFVALGDSRRCCSAEDLRGKRLYALAGIGDPARFFAQLATFGLIFDARPFPDHHPFSAADLAFASDGVLLLTEKDAVKCAPLMTSEAWILPVDAHVDPAPDGQSLLNIVLEKINGRALA